MAMEFVNGTPLDYWGTNASVDAIALIMIKIGNAVQLAHAHHIIHRDLKPANILVTKEGEPKVLDFGVARITRDGDSTIVTETGAVIGTRKYMSPEQASGSANVDERSDVYALGIMLQELLPANAPKDLRTIAAKASDEFQQRRYNNAGAFGEDLERWIQKEPIKARPATPIYTTSLWIRRHKLFTVLLCTISVAIFISVLQFNKSNWMRYVSLVQQSQVAYESGDIALMEASLEQCDDSMRNWEWYWLQQLASLGELPFKTLSAGEDKTGRLIASLPDGEVIDVTSGSIVRRITPAPHMTMLSEDCTTLVAQLQNGKIMVYSLVNPDEPPILIDEDTTIQNIAAMSISDNGKYVVLAITPALDPMDLSTLDANTRFIGINLDTHSVYLDDQLSSRILDTNASLDVSVNGTTIASSIYGAVTIWRFGDITDRRDIKISNSPPTISINKDGTILAVASLGSGTSHIKLLQLDTMLPIDNAPIIAHERGIIAVDFSPDSATVASLDSNGKLIITPLDGGPTINELLMTKEKMALVSFSSDAKKVFICQDDGVTNVYSTSPHIKENKIASGIKDALLQKGTLFVSLPDGHFSYNFTDETLTEVKEIPDSLRSPPRNPDGTRTVKIVKGGSIQLLDTSSNITLLTITWPQTQIITAGFIHDGRTLFAVSVSGKIRTWNVDNFPLY
jgi:serine/threonine protein kinase